MTERVAGGLGGALRLLDDCVAMSLTPGAVGLAAGQGPGITAQERQVLKYGL